MIAMLIASILLVALYTGAAIWKKRKLPESVSALVYNLPKKWQWMWTAWLTTCSCLLFEPIVVQLEWLGWLTVMCLLGCAVTPLVKPDTRKYHYWFAYAAGIMTQIDVLILDPQWLSVWMLFIFVLGSLYVQSDGKIAKTVEHKGAFVAEACCAISLFGCLIVNCVKLWIQQ